MLELYVEIEVFCENCGLQLKGDSGLKNYKQVLKVRPCPACLRKNYQDGFAEGSAEVYELDYREAAKQT